MDLRKRKQKKFEVFDPAPSGEFAYRVLEEAKVPGIVIGRLGVWAWVPEEEQQFTKDLDIAVRSEDLVFIRQTLHQKNLVTKELNIGGVNVRYPDYKINVDFIDRSSPIYGNLNQLFSEAIKASLESGEIVQIGSISLPVVLPEYLAVMKIATGEDDDERDVERIVEHGELDVDKTRELIKQHAGIAAIGRFEAILRKTGHDKAIRKPTYE